ncbi:type I restriction modification DNA specificity protein [Nicoletella semolina]|uniref:Type I restriction modification DNA specificity protein n=2 Tax=Nicoletella semolina TaxID=271160 RepID=A0A4V2SJJ2_9PAST|nr:type I restriction modification DNA specificity protein [Nicoletella semolina]
MMSELKLTDREWKAFKIGDLFDVNIRGRRLVASNRQQGKIPFVTAGESQNGISSFINNEEQITYSNAITLDMFGNAFYQKFDFKCDDNITVLINENINKYSAFFIVTLLNRLREKYSYGNQVRPNRLKNDKILLPINQSETPDWQFMEDFMRQFEKDKIKTILNYYNPLNNNEIMRGGGGKTESE